MMVLPFFRASSCEGRERNKSIAARDPDTKLCLWDFAERFH